MCILCVRVKINERLFQPVTSCQCVCVCVVCFALVFFNGFGKLGGGGGGELTK